MIQGDIDFYVAECMEFKVLGETFEGLTVEQAIKRYREIPEYLNDMGPGIGCRCVDKELGELDIELISSNVLDLGFVRYCIDYEAHPKMKQAIEKFQNLMPELEVRGKEELPTTKKEGRIR